VLKYEHPKGKKLAHAHEFRSPLFGSIRNDIGSTSGDEHAVTVAEELVILPDRVPVSGQHLLAAGERRLPASAGSI